MLERALFLPVLDWPMIFLYASTGVRLAPAPGSDAIEGFGIPFEASEELSVGLTSAARDKEVNVAAALLARQGAGLHVDVNSAESLGEAVLAIKKQVPSDGVVSMSGREIELPGSIVCVGGAWARGGARQIGRASCRERV